ncbi:non-motile and phage-resistance protein [Geobacter sp. OR-1]|uniref:histidine kinase dimerization/phospho-acceptor domain-containing protein n=1 Tax=Geobacter sp. OR-1 TaxID=1266765 RepID=UPI000542568C|nr:histidine kinase dimerization/phospho-acceptor domain-containing protein [Geobacter sp. OR-1]GAM09427.1 non-motile and phage-resistance protein [Geobacter sp. OR-1]
MSFHQFRIITRILLGFLVMLFAMAIIGRQAVNFISTIAGTSDDIFEHPFTVSTSISGIKSDLLSNQVRVAKLLNTTDPGEMESLIQGISVSKASADHHLGLLRTKYLGNAQDVEQLETAIAEWRAARENTVALIMAGRRNEAAKRIATSDTLAAEKALKEADDIYRFAADKAQEFRKLSANQSLQLSQTITLTFIFLIGASIVIAVIVTRSVAASLNSAGSIAKRLAMSSSEKVEIVRAISAGDLDRSITVSEPIELDESTLPRDELGNLIKSMGELADMQIALDRAFQQMTDSLRESRASDRAQDWLKSGQNELGERMRGDMAVNLLAENVLGFLSGYLNAAVGSIYLYDEVNGILRLASSYAVSERKEQCRLGEGVLGQAARDRQTITIADIPPAYLKVSSASGEIAPLIITAIPLTVGDQLVGAMEFGTFRRFNEVESELLEQAGQAISIAFVVAIAREENNRLLQQTLSQTEELRVQQEELQQSNEELEERAQMLEQQREQIRAKNREITTASEELGRKAAELERVSSYKSEFLANMSHELRTPLNSMMILSRLLSENREGNLTAKQVEFATTINSAGTDLVNLINDILDLSKIEAGRLEYIFEPVSLPSVCSALEGMFRPLTEQKGIGFHVLFSDDLPEKTRHRRAAHPPDP